MHLSRPPFSWLHPTTRSNGKENRFHGTTSSIRLTRHLKRPPFSQAAPNNKNKWKRKSIEIIGAIFPCFPPTQSLSISTNTSSPSRVRYRVTCDFGLGEACRSVPTYSGIFHSVRRRRRKVLGRQRETASLIRSIAAAASSSPDPAGTYVNLGLYAQFVSGGRVAKHWSLYSWREGWRR